MNEIDRLKPSRLIVWDAKGEFADEGYAQTVGSVAELVRVVVAAGPSGAFKVAYRPKGTPAQVRRAFDLIATLAFEAKNLTFVAEELSEVCQGGQSDSAGWRKCITQGRTEGLTIYALSQRPALIDKNTLGNASLTRCGLLDWLPDAKLMAQKFRCKPEELLDMPELAFIQHTRGGITRGSMLS
ncbi:hypothetical protein [Chitinilyticum aquatile]|uniref:hypothetical protein n=1 Tax=Chitinilyticum aquatile TaxID=362520 RepID=UPI00040325D9|nr:hypothetical protein [Chitinilyticum aquatile]